MGVIPTPVRAPGRAFPGPGWWLLGLGVLAMLLLAGPLVAGLTLAGALLLRWRSLDFRIAYFGVVAGASFVDYTRGNLTPELALLALALLFMLACYALSPVRPFAAVPHTPLTLPLAAFVLLTLVNFGRGLLAGNPPRYAGLEILTGLGLGTCLLVANRVHDRRHLREWSVALLALGLGHCLLGAYVFGTLHVRTGHLSFTPVPGLLVALFFNQALRARTLRGVVGWVLATLPMLLHQFLSFTRGYWVAILFCLAWSMVLFVGRGRGAGARGRRVAVVTGLVTAFTLGGILVLATLIGVDNLLVQAGSRLSSSVSTEMTYEAGSNVVRLAEYAQVFAHILRAPWLGHGLGYAFVVREPIHLQLLEQWFTHDNYLLVWVKQGLLGLAVFVWMLVAAVVTGARGRRLEDRGAAAWCTGTSAATVYVIVYSFVHFPLAEVNTTFALALMWGVCMSLVATGRTAIVAGRRTPRGVAA